ncbi:MAG: prolipoprotein diacylglyceryl transferase [Clostridia bacterium]
MDATLTLFGLTVHAYGLCAAAAALVLLALMGVLGYRNRLPAGTVRVFGLLGIPLGLVCARAVYCAINWSTFVETYENPWLMLRFFDGGLSMTGLLCGLVLAALITARVMKLRFGQVLDVLCVPLGLFIAILRMAERFTDLGVGKVVQESAITASMPWLFLRTQAGVNTEYRLAVYGYEAVMGVLLFAVMLVVLYSVRKHKRARSGDMALIFFALYGATQTLLESMRDDNHLLLFTFVRFAQFAAAMMPMIAAGIFSRRYLHIAGKGGVRLWATWAVLLCCVAGLVFLEFSLDGRIPWGNPTLLCDYALMAALCVTMLLMPCSLYVTLSKRLYREERFSVHVSQG